MRGARVGVVLVSAALTLSLAACTAGGTTPQGASPTQTAWTEQPTPGATSGGGAGSTKFDASGSATANKTAFDTAIRGVLSGNAKASGTTVAAALKTAGFPMSATQVSASKTSANLQPGSIMVGVKVGTECLVGQWGSAVGGFHSTVTPVLGSGGCLIGGIRPVG